MQIRTYDTCARMWATRKRKLANNTYLVKDGDDFAVRLHSTNVVTYRPNGDIVLNSGGWRTVTTKDRINEFSPFSVSQEAGEWTVHGLGKPVGFADGMIVHEGGEVDGAEMALSERKTLRKRIHAFSRNYLDAFRRGEIDAPSAGDCWLCLMTDVKTGKAWGEDDTSHLLSHLDERYYVPSLLARAAQNGGLSLYAQAYMSNRWADRERWERECKGWMEGVAIPQLRRALANYMLRHFSMTPTRTTYSR